MKKDRIAWIDATRALLIILVIFNHIFDDCYAHNLISTFHMPAFFILSGILFSSAKKDFRVFLSKKIRSLLIPYVFFEAIGTVATNIFSYRINFFGFISNTLLIRCVTGADWFLIALFSADILLFGLNKLIEKSQFKQYIYIATAIVFGIISCLLPDSHGCIVLGRTMMALVFMIAGVLLKSLFIKPRAIAAIFCALITCAIAYVNGRVGIALMLVNNPILFFIGSITGSYAVVFLGSIMAHVYGLTWYGRNSLPIMGTHQPLIMILRNYMTLPIGLFAFVVIAEIPIVLIMNRYLPFALGRNSK